MTFARSMLVTTPIFAFAALALGACAIKNDGSSPSDTSTPEGCVPSANGDAGADANVDGGDLGECVTYTPATIADTKSGTFTSNSDEARFTLPTTDVGGGLLKVTMAAQTQAMRVSVWLDEGEKKDESRWDGGVLDEESGSYYVRLLGGKTYELRAQPWNFRDDKTNGYTVSWEYQPLVDCYEGNDTREAAKRIPLDTPIKAHLHAGIGPNDGLLVGPTADDWYYFDVAEQRTATLRVNQPGDNTAYFSVLNDQNVVVTCNDPNFGMGTSATDTAEDMASCDATLAPGRYWVQGAIANSEDPGTSVGSEPPPSWTGAYTLTIETR